SCSPRSRSPLGASSTRHCCEATAWQALLWVARPAVLLLVPFLECRSLHGPAGHASGAPRKQTQPDSGEYGKRVPAPEGNQPHQRKTSQQHGVCLGLRNRCGCIEHGNLSDSTCPSQGIDEKRHIGENDPPVEFLNLARVAIREQRFKSFNLAS